MGNIDIIIVNWNAGGQLQTCIDSVIRYGQSLVSNIIVIDNNSSDGSEAAAEGMPNVTLIRANKNLGFGKACNLGATQTKSEFLLFLNPDTELFENSLAVPLAFMEEKSNSNVGICGIQLVDEKRRVAHTCARFPSLLRFASQAIGLNKIPGLRGTGVHMAEWDHLSDKSVDQVIGAFFFMRGSVFAALQGFDERFFVYFEEVDLSLRAKQAGWRSVFLAGAQAFHQGGGTSRQVKAIRLFYSLRSRLLYGFKQFPRWQAWMLICVTMVIEPVSRLLLCSVRGQRDGALDTIRGYRMLWLGLNEVVHSCDNR